MTRTKTGSYTHRDTATNPCSYSVFYKTRWYFVHYDSPSEMQHQEETQCPASKLKQTATGPRKVSD